MWLAVATFVFCGVGSLHRVGAIGAITMRSWNYNNEKRGEECQTGVIIAAQSGTLFAT